MDRPAGAVRGKKTAAPPGRTGAAVGGRYELEKRSAPVVTGGGAAGFRGAAFGMRHPAFGREQRGAMAASERL